MRLPRVSRALTVAALAVSFECFKTSHTRGYNAFSMEQTLHQLGQLLLGAIPTMVLLLALFAAYRALVAGPLDRALEERYARTDGAFEQAKSDVNAADSRSLEYEKAIREARVSIFKALESRRGQALQARAAAAAEARKVATAGVQQEKEQIAQQMAVAQKGLAQDSERLANEIIRTILSGAGAPPPAAGGQP
jgi:F-type H+-transporting ATPase subunit b